MSRLAVLIPVYRNQDGLTRTIESLRAAEGDFDVFIVDDGSPEPAAAPELLRTGVSVTLLRLEQNQGIARALNHGLREILDRNYDYVGRLDTSDSIVCDRFSQQVRFLDEHPRCAVVSSFINFVDSSQMSLFEYRAPSQHEKIRDQMRLNNCLVHSGSMIRSDALKNVGLYREDSPVTEDYDLFLRIARQYTLAVLPRALTCCEYSRSGLSIAGRRVQQWQRLKLQMRYFDPASAYSFLGVVRTLLAMLIPHEAALYLKKAHSRRVNPL